MGEGIDAVLFDTKRGMATVHQEVQNIIFALYRQNFMQLFSTVCEIFLAPFRIRL